MSSYLQIEVIYILEKKNTGLNLRKNGMRRHTTTLNKLAEAEDRSKAEAVALAKKRAALRCQRKRRERQAKQVQYVAVGQLVERLGLPIADIRGLELLLKMLRDSYAGRPE